MLLHVAVCCSVLYFFGTPSISVLQCGAVYCSVLRLFFITTFAIFLFLAPAASIHVRGREREREKEKQKERERKKCSLKQSCNLVHDMQHALQQTAALCNMR